MPRAEPRVRADYRHIEPIGARWNDLDIFGHINNAVFYELFDTVILRLLTATGDVSSHGAYAALVAQSGASFHREVLFSDRIEVGLRCSRVGRTSVTYELSVFTGGRDDSAVDGSVVHVFVDRVDRRPVEIAANARLAFEGLLVS